MAKMNEFEIITQERDYTGTSWTRNEQFDKDGYLVVKDLWDKDELFHPLPNIRGLLNYWGKDIHQVSHEEVEEQVEGSLARYWHPQYRSIHHSIRLKLEKIIGRKLYTTYYYDRFYFPGQELSRHLDRPACEISVSVHISTNLTGENAKWPFKIKTPDVYTDKTKTVVTSPGEVRTISLEAGDGLVYKGCERPHWRESMPTEYTKRWFKKVEKDGLYYHQIFFHYVIADGQRAHCSGDMSR
jgi:hypothetical protein